LSRGRAPRRLAAILLLAALGLAGPRTRYRAIAAVLLVLALTLAFDGLMRLLEWRLSASRSAGGRPRLQAAFGAAPG